MDESHQQLGKYSILEKIAQGGMAQIYKAKTADPSGIERFVVIKRILPHISSNPEYVEMLIDEAKIAVHFTHGNVAQVYDLGKVDEDYFIVMEYVDGKTLSQILREFKERGEEIPLDLIVYWMMEACRGLDYIHNKSDPDGNALGIIHRDISPQNIIVSYSGTVKIIDFGVAKALEKSAQTESGVLKGKYAYMSPEQADGEAIDRRTDIFSAGILLWELLTQQRLFKKKSNRDTIKAVCRAQVPSPSKMRLDIPSELDKIVLKALQRKKGRRYENASEMAADLARLLMELNPDFRPLNVAQFLYRYFGPESDEEGLPPEMPQLAVPRKPKPVIAPGQEVKIEEEKTEVEFDRMSVWQWLKKPLVWGSAIGCLIVILGLFGIWRLPYFNRGTLILNIAPKEAQLLINEAPIELTDKAYQSEYQAGDPIRIQVELEGYKPYETTVNLKRKEVRTISVSLEKEIPPYGDIYIESHPPSAKIYLANIEWKQRTPAKIPHLAQNKKYHIGVFLEGYKFLEKVVSVKGGEVINLQFDLQVDYATLEIRSSPPGVRVTIENQVVGQTPYISRRIKPQETLEFSLELEGFQTVNSSVHLRGGEKKELSFDLKEIVEEGIGEQERKIQNDK